MKHKIDGFLNQNLTPEGYLLWLSIKLPYCFDRPTSSSGKYHKRANGLVATNGEHVLSMLRNAKKIESCTGFAKCTTDMDIFYLAIVLHDALKYGYMGVRTKTWGLHDKAMADMILDHEDYFKTVYSDEQIQMLVDCVRYHNGIWSTDLRDSVLGLTNVPSLAQLIHFIDMSDTNGVNFTEAL